MSNTEMPAFPVSCDAEGNTGRVYGQGMSGMSLRDYFAGQALIAFAQDDDLDIPMIAHLCYDVADEMLIKRQEEGDEE